MSWREEWQERRLKAPKGLDFDLPKGDMRPLGYVVSRYSVREVQVSEGFCLVVPKRVALRDYREKVEGAPGSIETF